MNPSATVFEQVWDGRLPSFPIFRSDKHHVQVILDIFPAQPGHVLVIPKEPIDHIFELPPYRYLQVCAAGQVAAQQIMGVLHPLRVMHIVSGYDIPHVHLHLLPSFQRGDTEASLLAGRSGVRATKKDLVAMQSRLMFSPEMAAMLERRLDAIAAQDEERFSRGADVASLMRRL